MILVNVSSGQSKFTIYLSNISTHFHCVHFNMSFNSIHWIQNVSKYTNIIQLKYCVRIFPPPENTSIKAPTKKKHNDKQTTEKRYRTPEWKKMWVNKMCSAFLMEIESSIHTAVKLIEIDKFAFGEVTVLYFKTVHQLIIWYIQIH